MISKEQVSYIASLARLKLTEGETESFTTQLNDILKFVEELNQLDTDGVEPMSHTLSMTNVLREDVMLPSIARAQALKNAPEQQDGMFRVPAIFHE